MRVALARRGVWLSLGWALIVVVVYLSLTPKPPSADISQIDKVGHLLAYATLMGWWSQLDTRHCRLALLFVLLGLAMEIAQGLTDYRQGDVLDMAANSVGVGIGWLVSRLRPDWLRLLDRSLTT
jgi:VanZ family protein